MNRIEHYRAVIESILGKPIGNSRKRDDVAARMCLAYQLHADGYTSGQIGKMLGRDHATVLHMIKMMEACKAYPRAYRRECDLWEEFEELLNYNDK